MAAARAFCERGYRSIAVHHHHHYPKQRSVRALVRRSLGTTASSTADGTRIFFEWLERRYGARFGGRPLPMDNGSNSTHSKDATAAEVVVTKDSLETDDLERLFRHEISVLRIRGFYPPGAAARLGAELASEGRTAKAQNWKVSTSRGLESSDVFTLGRHAPYNIALANQQTKAYFDNVRGELRERRGLDAAEADGGHRDEGGGGVPSIPRLWPLDLFRLELDELWPRGAGLARAAHPEGGDHCMGGGLPRLMVGPTRWKKGLVHVDELAPLSPTGGCFSANIYLQLPYGPEENKPAAAAASEQPVLEVWPLGIRSKWDWYRNAPTLSHLAAQDPEGQLILRKTLGEHHKATVSARPGDLVLLCVQRPHCAIGFGHEDHRVAADATRLQTRVSLQCFLQYNGSDERLTIDS